MIWSSSAKLRKFWQIIFEASKIIDPHVGTASKAKSPPVTQTVPDQESANLRLGEKDLLEVFGFNHPVASKRLSTRSRKNEKNVKVNHPNCNYKELDSEKMEPSTTYPASLLLGGFQQATAAPIQGRFNTAAGLSEKLRHPQVIPMTWETIGVPIFSFFSIFPSISGHFWGIPATPWLLMIAMAEALDGWDLASPTKYGVQIGYIMVS